MKRIKSEKGSTLLELILFIALYSGVITAATMMIVNLITLEQKITFLNYYDSDARIALNRMTTSIQQGYNILSPSTDTSNTTSLVVQTDSTGDTATYSVSSNHLYYQYDSNPAIQITSSNTNISSLSFERMSTGGQTPSVFIFLTFKSPISISPEIIDIGDLATQRKE